MAKVTSFVRGRFRALGITTAVAMTAALVASPAAFGAADPVASGKFNLKLSKSFKKQLRQNGVKMKPRKFRIVDGDVDPTTGRGTVELRGKLRFKKGGKKLVYRKLSAKIGKGGNLKGSAGKVFKLRGGKVVRNGFGANITGVKAKFLRKAAKRINRKLDLDSLHQGNAGRATARNVQPEEVTLVGGTATLIPNLTTFTKFGAHCIDPLGTGTTGTQGIAAIAPATGTSAPSFSFPISGGQVSPDGTTGTANGSGGIAITNNILNDNAPAPGSLCNTISQGTSSQVRQTDLTLDLSTKQIQARVVISGTEQAALDGDKGIAFIGTISGGSVAADPATRQITISNLASVFNATAAQVLNGSFPCDNNNGFSANPADGGCLPSSPARFGAGDPIGTISVTAQAQ